MIAFFVGGRSDGGILSPLIAEVGGQVIHGKYHPDDTPHGIAKSAAWTLSGVADDLMLFGPDMLVILGDRFEALAAAQAAYCMGVPICHLHGGEHTLGSRDDAQRHAISQLADLHLVSTEKAAAYVGLLTDGTVRVIGAIGAHNAHEAPAQREAGIIVSVPQDPAVYRTVMVALADYNKLVIGPNQDVGRSEIEGFTLSPRDFLAALKGADVIVGNSSCGIIEAPSADTWTVNVGDRQAGRQCAASVVHVPCEVDAIRHAVDNCLTTDFPPVDNPYYRGDSVKLAAEAIREWLS